MDTYTAMRQVMMRAPVSGEEMGITWESVR